MCYSDIKDYRINSGLGFDGPCAFLPNSGYSKILWTLPKKLSKLPAWKIPVIPHIPQKLFLAFYNF